MVSLTLFWLVCVLPTAGILAWTLAVKLPWHVRAEAQHLGWRLGLHVTLGAVAHLRPGVTVYEGLELADPATGHVAVRCPRLEATWETGADVEGRSRPFLVLRAAAMEVDAGQSEELHRLLDRLLACRVGWSDACARLEATRVRLSGGAPVAGLAAFQGRLESLAKGTWAGVAFRCDGANDGQRVSICFSRDRQTPSPVLHVDLNTGNGDVPCALIALGWSGLGALGSECQFCGEIQADVSGGSWDGQVRGHFSGVDLDGLVTRRFPHVLSGLGQVFLDQLEFRGGRIEKASGWVVAMHGGSISRSLIESAARWLSLEVPADFRPEPVQPFAQLGFRFAIEAGQLQLQGRCPLDSPRGSTLVLGQGGPILDAPRPGPVPLASLVQALAPPGAVQVSAAPQSAWLLDRLALVSSPDADLAENRATPRSGDTRR
jgi:hypothetical protein